MLSDADKKKFMMQAVTRARKVLRLNVDGLAVKRYDINFDGFIWEFVDGAFQCTQNTKAIADSIAKGEKQFKIVGDFEVCTIEWIRANEKHLILTVERES